MNTKPQTFSNFDAHTQQYLNLVQEIVDIHNKQGSVQDRTKVGRTRVFGKELIFNMTDGTFPLITCKHVPFRLMKEELFWFLQGSTNVSTLGANNHIWDKWALKWDVPVQIPTTPSDHFADIFNPDNSLFEKLMKLPKALIGDWSRKHVYRKGDIGPMYGKTWRNFDGVDQLAEVFELLQRQPYSARACVSAWDPKNFPIVKHDSPWVESDYEYQVTNGKMALNPCHAFFQFLGEPMSLKERCKWVLTKGDDYNHNRTKLTAYGISTFEDIEIVDLSESDKDSLIDYLDAWNVPSIYLSLKLTQRSCDLGLGAPFNIASYALLLNMYAMSLNYAVKELIYSLGDCHLYTNQIDVMTEMLDAAESSKETFTAPYLVTDFSSHSGVTIPYPWEQFNFAVFGEGDKFKIWELGGYKSLGVFKMEAAA